MSNLDLSANKRSANESVHNLQKEIQGSSSKRQKLEDKTENESDNEGSDSGDQKSKKWKTLEHHGMTFP